MSNVARMGVGRARAHAGQLVAFCTHCGALTEPQGAMPGRPHAGRVCEDCGLGVVLTCERSLLRSRGAPFLVVNRDLCVSAASQRAERIFGPDLGGRHLLSLVTSPQGRSHLVRHVIRAAGGATGIVRITVAAAGTTRRIGRLEARIGSCGDPCAALVVFERPLR
jgi:hypothetical protein